MPVISLKIPEGSRFPYNRNINFAGREKDLQALADALICPGSEGSMKTVYPGIAVYGQPGIGKTELAIEFVYRYGRFFHGIHWLQGGGDLKLGIAACGTALSLKAWPKTISDQVAVTIEAWSSMGPRQVVLDNAVNSDELPGAVLQIPELRFLVTTLAENTFDSIGFSLHKLGSLSSRDSRRVLSRLAPHLEGVSKMEVLKLIDRLEGLPFSLHLAGNFLANHPEVTPKQYLARLDSARPIFKHALIHDRLNPHQEREAPVLALALSTSWKVLRTQYVDTLVWRLFHIFGYCAPDVPVACDLLAAVLRSTKHDTELHLGELYRLGLLKETPEGPVVHSLSAEFARWIGEATGEESFFHTFVEVVIQIVREANEAGLVNVQNPLREHLSSVAGLAEEMGIETTGALLNSLGYYHWAFGDYEGAGKFFQGALAVTEKYSGSDHANVAATAFNLGEVLVLQDKLPAARVCFEQALKIWQKSLGEDHPKTAKAMIRLGDVLWKREKRLTTAQAYYEQALLIFRSALGVEHPDVADAVSRLGNMMFEAGDLESAQACYEQALRIEERVFGPEHMVVADRLDDLARIAEGLDDFEHFQTLIERSVKIRRKTNIAPS